MFVIFEIFNVIIHIICIAIILILMPTGFPIALSYPHFYMADPTVLSSVEGLNPRPEVHESYFLIQPQSGLPVDLAFRFQINMALQDISAYPRVEKFKDMVLPLLWFEIVSMALAHPDVTLRSTKYGFPRAIKLMQIINSAMKH